MFQRLFLKLEEERQALGGKVFDILGKVSFDNKSLRDLLIEAVRYGNDPEVRARLNRVVDKSLDPQIFRDIIRENALTDDAMDIHMVNAIREIWSVWRHTSSSRILLNLSSLTRSNSLADAFASGKLAGMRLYLCPTPCGTVIWQSDTENQS